MSKISFNIQGKLKQGMSVYQVIDHSAGFSLREQSLILWGQWNAPCSQQEKKGKKHTLDRWSNRLQPFYIYTYITYIHTYIYTYIPYLVDRAKFQPFHIHTQIHIHLMEVARHQHLYFFLPQSLYFMSQQSLSNSTKITMWLHSVFLLINDYNEYMLKKKHIPQYPQVIKCFIYYGLKKNQITSKNP